jgi:hypothetical protein
MLIALGQSQSATPAARVSEVINVDQMTILLRYTLYLELDPSVMRCTTKRTREWAFSGVELHFQLSVRRW